MNEPLTPDEQNRGSQGAGETTSVTEPVRRSASLTSNERLAREYVAKNHNNGVTPHAGDMILQFARWLDTCSAHETSALPERWRLHNKADRQKFVDYDSQLWDLITIPSSVNGSVKP